MYSPLLLLAALGLVLLAASSPHVHAAPLVASATAADRYQSPLGLGTLNKIMTPLSKLALTASLSEVKECAKNSDADALDLESFELIPDHPKRGEPLQVRLKGQLRRTIDRPATVHVLVKLGRFIQLLKQDLDLCNEVGRVDLACPLNEGPIVIDKKFDLPNEIPPGTYYVTADITDQEGGPVTCVQVAVKFDL